MELILFRHGLAASREEWETTGQDDSLRPLVPKGEERSRSMAELIRKSWDDVDLLVSSPYLRATQTMKAIKPVVRAARVREAVELVPSAPPQAFVQWLREACARDKLVIAVGHEPHLSTLASFLLTGSAESCLNLKKSGALSLSTGAFDEMGPRCATLNWLLVPKLVLASR